jgi:hypothetical protein
MIAEEQAASNIAGTTSAAEASEPEASEAGNLRSVSGMAE